MTARDIVARMKKSGRLPHAFLFTDEKSESSMDAALYTAKLLLCENGAACGECRHCRRIEAAVHPDVMLPERTGKKRIYSKATIRSVCSDAFIRPNDCDSKVYIFSDCEHIEEAAQNLMLKLIEEPPDNVYFIFTASSKSVFLPTVLSRVAALSVNGGARDEVIDEELALSAKRITEGIIAGDEYRILTALAQIGESREKITEILILTNQIIRDACIVRLNSAGSADYHIGLIGCFGEGAQKLSKRLSFRKAVHINDAIHNALDYCRGNVNVTAAMSALAGQLCFE
ncbi:MAG: hypothetical protein FWG90_00720 [Oscillospiraceae bacterium]|nr:hypothetical protein [Oscillospiraceae bacterium]